MQFKPKIEEKRFSIQIEKNLADEWLKEKPFKINKDAKKIFSIDTPPPYVNTPIHIGHATTYILMDFFARYKRMKGYAVLFPLGLDRNGLPIEIAAEKKFNISAASVGKEKFLEYCKKILDEAGTKSIDIFKRLGISFNSYEFGDKLGDAYLTDSPNYRALTQLTFIELWEKGLIYEASHITNFCPGCKTTIADAEVVYEERPSAYHDIKFKIKETNEEVIISTTRPELLASCAMVIFNPEDERYKHLENKTAIVPIYGQEVPIKAHPMAQIEKGTGLMMMCSFGDITDIRFFREQGLKAKILIDANGRMNKLAGFLEGLTPKEARKKIVEKLKEEGLLVKVTPIMHRIPICERSKDEIEFVAFPEFYLKQVEFKEEMLKIAQELNFYEPKSKQILIDWINTVSIDWPISRRRYYATEIPIWYCKNCKEVILGKKGDYTIPWKQKPPVEKCPKCNCKEFIPETRVFDTWFDSSNTPLYILQYAKDKKFFEKHIPCSLRPQGKEIIRTWLYYTLLKNYLLNKTCIFKDVWINYHVVDEKGKKMSKSLGNVIDPKEVVEKYGAEPLRLWAALEGNITSGDFRCSMERISATGKTITKLWNIARFVSMFPEKKKAKLSELDKSILEELNSLIKFCDECYSQYDFHNPAIKLRRFLWESFASNYLELVKPRAYNSSKKFSKEEQEAAFYTMHTCLKTLLLLLSPILPFITYYIYKKLYNKKIYGEKFPSSIKCEKAVISFSKIEELNTQIWKFKKSKSLSLKDKLLRVKVPEIFKYIEKDIKEAHNISKLEYGKEFEVIDV